MLRKQVQGSICRDAAPAVLKSTNVSDFVLGLA